jgi:hypothetical protein
LKAKIVAVLVYAVVLLIVMPFLIYVSVACVMRLVRFDRPAPAARGWKIAKPAE